VVEIRPAEARKQGFHCLCDKLYPDLVVFLEEFHWSARVQAVMGYNFVVHPAKLNRVMVRLKTSPLCQYEEFEIKGNRRFTS